jgi:RNA polymerase sigma factor (sigma-70 family)
LNQPPTTRSGVTKIAMGTATATVTAKAIIAMTSSNRRWPLTPTGVASSAFNLLPLCMRDPDVRRRLTKRRPSAPLVTPFVVGGHRWCMRADGDGLRDDVVPLLHAASTSGRRDRPGSRRRHERPGVARRHLNRRAEIDDVVQEVWIALIKNLDRIHAPESLRSWLWAVTSRFAVRQSKNLARVALLGDGADVAGEESAEDKGLGRLAGNDCRGRVRHALRRLDAADQQLLELLFAVDRPCYRAIGRIVNRPVGSIGPTRQRLLGRLRGDPDLQLLGAP